MMRFFLRQNDKTPAYLFKSLIELNKICVIRVICENYTDILPSSEIEDSM
ncbi:hypothetical protein [Chryseobacterium contaminans]